MTRDDNYEISRWLSLQSEKLEQARQRVFSDEVDAKVISELESVVRGYVERANEGTIFQAVFGYDNIVFDAQELLAAAYFRQGRYDDALVLHRYVANTVQSLVRDRIRNTETLTDVRKTDLDHLARTATFLVRFSRAMSTDGDPEAASQLLSEAIRLSDAWDLNTKYPELNRMIDEQLNETNR